MRALATFVSLTLLHSSASVLGMALMAQADNNQCANGFAQSQQRLNQQQLAAPAAAAKRLPQSQATRGQQDIAWAWLASPTARYPHSSMGRRPTVVVPDMSRRALHALRWESIDGKVQWKELADVKPLPGRVTYLMPLTANSACAQLSDKNWWRIDLTP